MATAEQQKTVCDDLNSEIMLAENKVFELKEKYRNEKSKLQALCEHVYMREDDGDYHRKGYLYICENCQFVTRKKPEVFKLSPW